MLGQALEMGDGQVLISSGMPNGKPASGIVFTALLGRPQTLSVAVEFRTYFRD